MTHWVSYTTSCIINITTTASTTLLGISILLGYNTGIQFLTFRDSPWRWDHLVPSKHFERLIISISAASYPRRTKISARQLRNPKSSQLFPLFSLHNDHVMKTCVSVKYAGVNDRPVLYQLSGMTSRLKTKFVRFRSRHITGPMRNKINFFAACIPWHEHKSAAVV